MKKNVAVIYGGYSSEHDISVKSGKYVSSIIDKKLFDVFEIHITKNDWNVVGFDVQIDKSDFSFTNNNVKILFQAAVIVIHGNPGEDGILQSYLDLLKIPYTTCNHLTSALTFNKFFCNNYIKNFGVKVAESIILIKDQEYSEILQKFTKKAGFPVFVKPNEGGSSYGTFKVKNESELIPSVLKAFEHSNQVIVEEFIKGRELTCGVIKFNNKIKALTPCEIVSKNDFFDYEAKYNANFNEEIIPARFSDEIIEKCKKISEHIYKTLNCSGIVRIDYIEKEDELYFLELNSVPGMTSESIVPKILKYEKIDISELFTFLITEALSKSQ